MFQSIRHPQIVLRVGLALVFLWFGVDKFISPQYWVSAWVPQSVQVLLAHLGVTPVQFVSLLGIFEVLVAISMATGFFMRWFAAAAALFLLSLIPFNGITEITMRDIGLIGGLIALAIWPERSYI